MHFNCAILRTPSKSIINGLSQHEIHEKPHYDVALKQHEKYKETIEKIGLFPIVCEAKEEFPDGCFVEDTHLILAEVAIRLNPGASSRSQEPDSLFDAIPRDRPFKRIPEEFKIDGGDILVSGKRIYVGLSERTQQRSISTLNSIVSEHGYQVVPVPVPEGLHLKSGVTLLNQNTFIVQKPFQQILDQIHTKLGDENSKNYFIVPEEEHFAANVLALNGSIIIPTGCPKTKEFVLQFYPADKVHEVDTSEFRKVDGALTCLSIPLKTQISKFKTAIERRAIEPSDFQSMIDFDKENFTDLMREIGVSDTQIRPLLTHAELRAAHARGDILEWLFVDGNQLAGCLWLEKKTDCLFLNLIALRKEFYGRGLCKYALNTAEQKAREYGLESCKFTVIPQNGRAVNAYFKHGYHIVKCVPSYYGPDHPDTFRFIMEKKLTEDKTKKEIVDRCEIPCSDNDTLEDASNRGYVGVGIVKSDGQMNSENRIIFEKYVE